ncbi:hypothetical protein [Deinococcus sonorensis]|uniref:Esterase n=2 Tax=Deinococcus sonorensis TaxID=309891 RepID=A0AAU7UBR4_9DEIO
MQTPRLVAPLALITALLASCNQTVTLTTEQQVQAAVTTTGVVNAKTTTLTDGSVYLTGTLKGNAFAARFPAKWNGQSVLSAHGYVYPGTAERTPDLSDTVLASTTPGNEPSLGLFPTALSQGYAIANTAYAKTGYAVKEGVAANKQLHDFMKAAGSKSQYMTGISMGGNITVALVEQYPQDFVGAMPYCGVVAGWRAEERYLLDFRVVYDYFTKGTVYALPGNGDAVTVNPALTLPVVQQSVVGLFTKAAQGDLAAKAIIGQVSAVVGAPADPISYITALGSTVYGLQDYLTTTGGTGYSNKDKVYAGSQNDVALNAGVQRISASAESSAYLDANYTPTGNFKAKMLSFHNLVDPLVPYSFEPEFKAIVSKAGNSANLVQQVVDANPVNAADPSKGGPTHCYFTPKQVSYAWNELRAWVDNGVKPAEGENITSK